MAYFENPAVRQRLYFFRKIYGISFNLTKLILWQPLKTEQIDFVCLGIIIKYFLNRVSINEIRPIIAVLITLLILICNKKTLNGLSLRTCSTYNC